MWKRTSTIVLASLIVFSLGVVAHASVGEDGYLHGCARITSGALRVIDTGQSCRVVEYAVDWRQGGPIGAPSFQMMAGSFETDAEGGTYDVVMCPEGSKAVGGTAWIDLGWGEIYPLVVKLVDDERGILKQYAEVDFLAYAYGDPHTVTYNITCQGA